MEKVIDSSLKKTFEENMDRTGKDKTEYNPTFWEERLKEAFEKQKHNPKKYWELCSLMVYKYELNIKVRGVPASMIAYKLLKENGELLTPEEKEFLGEVLSG